MNGLIIYKSKTGFTKTYAQWLQQETHFDLVEFEHVENSQLIKYDIIIFGSRIHAGRLDGFKKMKEMLVKIENPHLVVFATGGTPLEAKEAVQSIWNATFTESDMSTIPHFYMPSGLSYESMDFKDKFIMKTLAKILSKKEKKDEEEVGCENAIGDSYDISSKEYLLPLLKYIELRSSTDD